MSALLKALGSRGEILATIDFEAFYSVDYSLSKLTTEAYVRDPRFEVIGVGVKWGNQPSVWLEEWEFREWAARVDWSRVAVNAHHAQLDAFILSHHYGIRPGFLCCTMSMARAVHGVSGVGLERLGPMYGLGEKGTALEKTKGKRRRDFTQAEWKAFGDYCNQDVTLTAGLLRAMGKTFPKEELWLIDSTIRMFTEPVFEADQAVLQKALDAERLKKRDLLRRVAETAGAGVGGTDAEIEERARAVLSSNEKFAELLKAMGVEPPTKVGKPAKDGSPRTIFAFAKGDPGMQDLLEHEREDIQFLAEARLAVKSTITETRAGRVIGIAQRGPIPFYLKYCGAHTHRWSGGDKMNPQNFNRGGALRDAILAAIGFLLAVCDSAQIEARVLAWLAGEAELLETFRRNDEKARVYAEWIAERVRGGLTSKEAKAAAKAAGLDEGDFYSDRGSVFFLKKISKEETPIERQLSKNMILGLGFSMGWEKFAGELLKGMLGSAPVQFTMTEARKFGVDVEAFAARESGFGARKTTNAERVRKMKSRLGFMPLLIHCAVADHFVRMYRNASGGIVRLWRAMDEIIATMAVPLAPGADPNEVRMTFGVLKVIYQGIVKPNGLVMRYPGLRKTGDGFKYLGGKSGREHVKIYGGLLTENCVQSLARDVVAEQALWIRADGYRLGTTTHDEVVAVPPEHDAERCLDKMKQRMKVPPAWCLDLPLNVSGGFGRSYGAVK